MAHGEKDLQQKLKAIESMDRPALLNEFERTYKRPPPPRLSNRILALAIAYRLQEQVYGGLKPEIRKLLLSKNPEAMARKASPGTLLIREWKGQQYQVIVHEGRVEYSGKAYGSLTEVAFHISGQKVSGPRFFGLRRKLNA